MQMNSLKQLRIEKNLTQLQAANKIGISLRSYVSYENNANKTGTAKYNFLVHEIEKLNLLDEEHGILSKDDIIKACSNIFSDYNIDYCYLFGSYAKGKAKETSDVDLLVATDITGLKYYELLERLRESLHKKVDMIDLKQLLKNQELLNEILKDGIRIYG